MTDIFQRVVNMSFSTGFLIVAVLVLRMLLKKAPRQLICLLWGLVALRLVCPFSVESAISLIPSAEPIPRNYASMKKPQIDSGIEFLDQLVNPAIGHSIGPNTVEATNELQIWMEIGGLIWVLGCLILVIYAAISYRRLYKTVRISVPVGDRVYLCDEIATPFILGIVRPRIYLPSGMEDEVSRYIIAHEKMHLKRLDHFWKPFGYLLLAVYWFHPLIWLAYILLCRDIEMACDERVVKDMELADKKAYSKALVTWSTKRRMIAACPLAFGEVGVKMRVKTVLNYKKPSFWIIVFAVIAVVGVVAFFMTNPISEKEEPKQPEENVQETHQEEPETTPVEIPTLEEVMKRIEETIPLSEAIPLITTADLPEGDQLYYLDATADGKYALYGFHSDEYGYTGLFIDYKLNGTSYRNYISDIEHWIGYEFPHIAETETGDLCMTYCYGGGTGVHVDRFFYFQANEDGSLKRYELTVDSVMKQAEECVSFNRNEEDKVVEIFSREGGREELFAAVPYEEALNGMEYTIQGTYCDSCQVKFMLEPNLLILGYGFLVEESFMPVHIGELAFEIEAEADGDEVKLVLGQASTYSAMGVKEFSKGEKQGISSEEEAVALVTEQLITAYKNVYGPYVASDVEPVPYCGDAEWLAYKIPRLEVSEETEEYYVIPVIWDFRVYKQSGEVKVYYNGIDPMEYTFDPLNPNHMAFAG